MTTMMPIWLEVLLKSEIMSGEWKAGSGNCSKKSLINNPGDSCLKKGLILRRLRHRKLTSTTHGRSPLLMGEGRFGAVGRASGVESRLMSSARKFLGVHLRQSRARQHLPLRVQRHKVAPVRSSRAVAS